MIIIALGAPGTGKGTMSRKLSEYYGIPHISTGDILREMSKENNDKAKQIKDIIDKGLLVSDDILEQVLKERLAKKDCRNGYILDGYPRNLNQAKFLDELLERKGDTVTAAFKLNTPKEELIDRILGRIVCPKCNAIFNEKYKKPVNEGRCDNCDTILVKRNDDTPEKIEKRLEEYEINTEPVIKYYDDKGILFTTLVSDMVNKMGNEVLKSLIWYIENNNKN